MIIQYAEECYERKLRQILDFEIQLQLIIYSLERKLYFTSRWGLTLRK